MSAVRERDLRCGVVAVYQFGDSGLLQEFLHLFPFFECIRTYREKNAFAMSLFIILIEQPGFFD